MAHALAVPKSPGGISGPALVPLRPVGIGKAATVLIGRQRRHIDCCPNGIIIRAGPRVDYFPASCANELAMVSATPLIKRLPSPVDHAAFKARKEDVDCHPRNDAEKMRPLLD